MLEKIKGVFAGIAEEQQRKREEREKLAREKAEREARLLREKIQAEKDALMKLSEKELMVETIMALRGYGARITTIEEHQEELVSEFDNLRLRVDYLERQNADDTD